MSERPRPNYQRVIWAQTIHLVHPWNPRLTVCSRDVPMRRFAYVDNDERPICRVCLRVVDLTN